MVDIVDGVYEHLFDWSYTSELDAEWEDGS